MSHEHVKPQTGESAPFHFENCWRVNATADEVWSVLSQVDEWPQWWPGLPTAVPHDDTVTPGSRAQVQVHSPIGLKLDFGIEVQTSVPPNLVSFTADGDLRGTGTWQLVETGPITTVTATWCVTTRKPAIRMLRPVAAKMHSLVMAAGERGLARVLNQ